MSVYLLSKWYLQLGLALYLLSSLANAEAADWHCKVEGSNDYFSIYGKQKTFETEQFIHYQLINGLTLIVLNKTTLRFNRLTNLNLLPSSSLDPNQPPEPMQFFSGECQKA